MNKFVSHEANLGNLHLVYQMQFACKIYRFYHGNWFGWCICIQSSIRHDSLAKFFPWNFNKSNNFIINNHKVKCRKWCNFIEANGCYHSNFKSLYRKIDLHQRKPAYKQSVLVSIALNNNTNHTILSGAEVFNVTQLIVRNWFNFNENLNFKLTIMASNFIQG